ncbi:MAG: BrnT family toxin [Chthoniobacterales bacterium]|nr:BrnT family toxin [Chthoniobacterales bacterium]
MEFEWTENSFASKEIPSKEIEETFEDPFSIRLMPEFDAAGGREARYFILGRAVSNRALFSVFWTDGKRYRVVFSRVMSPEEEAFYERKNLEAN